MKIRLESAPAGIFKIRIPPKTDLTFIDGVCEVEDIYGRRLLVDHYEFKQVIEPEIKLENKESDTPKLKVGRPAKKIEEVETSEAIKDFVKQI